MSYQVNLHNNTSVYVNRGDDANLLAAKNTETAGTGKGSGSVQAATETDEDLVRAMSGDEAIVKATSTQVMKNTEQYMEMLEQNGATVDSDDPESEEAALERKKEIYKNLTPEEIAKLKMMQVDLSAVSLSDIAGLVAGMRSEANQQEYNQRIADICDGVDAIRGRAMHESLKDVLKSLLPEEMDELAIDSVLERDYQIGEQQMIYLLKNEMQLTISNLYKSEYATSSGFQKSNTALSDEELEGLMPQIDAVLAQAGIRFSEAPDAPEQQVNAVQKDDIHTFMTTFMSRNDMIEGAKFMIRHGIALTPAAFRNYAAIQDINAHGMDGAVLSVNILMQRAGGGSAASANVYFNQQEAADRLTEMVSGIEPEIVPEAEQQGMMLTIQNLAMLTETATISDAAAEMEAATVSDAVLKNGIASEQEVTGAGTISAQTTVLEQMSRAEITARRQLEEIRLFMTQSAACRLVMSDLHIDTSELSEVVRKLCALEESMAKETFADYDTVYNAQDGALYQETMHKVNGLKQMPAAALSIVFRPEPLTVNSLYEEGMNQSLYFHQARESYETMMTTPRSDMGDSIKKAFDRADSLLLEMGIEPNQENRRAVRILGYNQMEITEASMDLIMEADAKVNQMLQQMTPKAVLDLIRKQQNPLDMSIDELNAVLAANRGDEEVNGDERFSQFLYKLEQKHGISEEEKQSFIGIYRLLDKVQKHSGRDIGFVVKAGETLTLKNLLSAHRSNQAKGIDFTASDENGVLESVNGVGTSISEQIETAFHTYGESMMQQALEQLQQETPDAYAEALYEQNRNMEFSGEAEAFAAQNQIPYSQGNLAAIDAMLADEAGIYGMIKNWLSEEKVANAHRQTINKGLAPFMEADLTGSESVKENADENMDSMFERMTVQFEDADTVKENYNILSQSLTEISYQGVLTHQDIQALKQIHTGFSILRRMAEQESYQVPLKVDGNWTVLNVRFVNNKQNQNTLNTDDAAISEEQHTGSITIDMHHKRYGRLVADISTGEEPAGQIETERAGVMEWPAAIFTKAEHALTPKEKYGLAKELFVVLSEL